eukprot:1012415_1
MCMALRVVMPRHLLLIVFLCASNAYQWSSSLLNFNESILYCKAQFNSSLATISTAHEDLLVLGLCSWNGWDDPGDHWINCWIGSHKDISKSDLDEGDCIQTFPDPYIDTPKVNITSCLGFLHPICNDPPTSDTPVISCNETRAQGQINTCVIYASDARGNPNIECNSNDPKCEIHFYKFGFEPNRWYVDTTDVTYSPVHCPRNECISCDILINAWASALKIHGHECALVSIRIMSTFPGNSNYHDYGLEWSVIFAPSAGGTLRIDGGTLGYNEIRSTLGTANIVIHLHYDLSVFNTIDGEYLSGYFNVSCIDTASCIKDSIICGSSDTECNIYCSGIGQPIVNYVCYQMNVYAEGGVSDVNWLCDDTKPSACFESTLQCDNSSDEIFSELVWDYINKWHYDTDDCDPFWTQSSITCTFTSEDTCYISKEMMDTSQPIQCQEHLPNCQIILGDNEGTNTWSYRLESIIHCPSSECDECIINCISKYACTGITIFGHKCSILQVNSKASSSSLHIFAPGAGGDLIVTTDPGRSYSSLSDSEIYSVPGTRNIIMDLNGWDSSNHINGTYVSNDLNLTCGTNAVCYRSNVICPNDANCNIDCSQSILGCEGMIVAALEGTHDVNWKCNDDSSMSCVDALLAC